MARLGIISGMVVRVASKYSGRCERYGLLVDARSEVA